MIACSLAIFVCVVAALAAGVPSAAHAAVSRTGILHEQVTDDFHSGRSTTHYALKSGGKSILLTPTELAASPGDRVTVTGTKRKNRLVGSVQSTTTLSAQTAVDRGQRKVAVILFRFPTDPLVPWSPSDDRSLLFTGARSANAFYSEESYGQISLSGKLRSDGDVFGWYTIQGPTTGCPWDTWQRQARQQAANAGVDLTGYDTIVYNFPNESSCHFSGIADFGYANINGYPTVATLTHELGHTMGLRHAGSMACTSGGVYVQVSATCTTFEYGDPFDVQGGFGDDATIRHHNGWNLEQLGILTPQNIRTIGNSGTYDLISALVPTSQPTVLRIPRAQQNGVTSWYYLEVRKTGGVFENVADATTTGVSIRETAPGQSPDTLLLDCNPATNGTNNTNPFADAPCAPGQTFDGGPVRVTTVSAGGGSARVTVQVPPDTVPPTAPTDLFAAQDDSGVQLVWTPSTDDVAVDHYDVYRDGVKVAATSDNPYDDISAKPGDHVYVVYAVDWAGNTSPASAPASVTATGVTSSDLVTVGPDGTAHVFHATDAGIETSRPSDTPGIDPALYDGVGEYLIDTADVTGDGRSDLVTIKGSGGVYDRPGQADGTFGAPIEARPTSLRPVMNGAGSLEPVAVADVNGDGRGDLVGIDYSNSKITTFLGQADGTFGAPLTNTQTVDSALFDGAGRYQLDVADVNGDGYADLISLRPDGWAVHRGTSAGTFTTFLIWSPLDNLLGDGVGEEPVGVGDVNYDGRADLVTLSGTTLKIRLGLTNSNSFGGATTAYAGSINSSLLDGTGDELVGLFDYNRDGRADLVTVNQAGNVLTYAAQSNATFAAPVNNGGSITSSRLDRGGQELAQEKPFLRRTHCQTTGCRWPPAAP